LNEYTKKLRSKGWTARAVASRWGISIANMTRISRNPKQVHLDALEGLKPQPPRPHNPAGLQDRT